MPIDTMDLATLIEEVACDLSLTASTLEEKRLLEALEDAAYELRLADNDVGGLLGYWDDPRFESRRRRDMREE